MRCYYDLHIHSVLSPCADVLMTPNNIFNMAMLKKLDIISVTDHNSLKQLEVCQELSKSYDFLFVPGVEVTVSEGFDVLIYFKNIEDALAFDLYLEKYLPKKTVDKNIYNEQTICDIYDQMIKTYPYLLSQRLNLSFNKLFKKINQFEHVIFFAHVDRYKELIKSWIEKYPNLGVEYKKHILYKDKTYLINSDSHQITDILERNDNNYIELKTLSIDCFFRYFNHG